MSYPARILPGSLILSLLILAVLPACLSAQSVGKKGKGSEQAGVKEGGNRDPGPGETVQRKEPGSTSDWAQRDFWQTTGGDPVSDGWEFSNGQVSLVKPRKGGNIVTRPLPPNFELSWQWKIEKGVNSGLKYRVRRFGKKLFGNSLLGLEYQIIDSKPDSTSMGSTAAIYALQSPVKEKTLHPPGKWNDA